MIKISDKIQYFWWYWKSLGDTLISFTSNSKTWFKSIVWSKNVNMYFYASHHHVPIKNWLYTGIIYAISAWSNTVNAIYESYSFNQLYRKGMKVYLNILLHVPKWLSSWLKLGQVVTFFFCKRISRRKTACIFEVNYKNQQHKLKINDTTKQ